MVYSILYVQTFGSLRSSTLSRQKYSRGELPPCPYSVATPVDVAHVSDFLIAFLAPSTACRVLAMEQAPIGGLKVLNYAPGPMLTDMLREARSAEDLEEGLRSGGIIDPKVSAEKCVRLALGGAFATGAHVDFFDKEEAC